MATAQTPPALPPIVYGTFVGAINQESLQKLFNTFAIAMNSKTVKHIHLIFQTSGGFIGDGIALYNYFKALPIDLTLYNTGTVASIGVIAYLRAKTRKTSKYSAFTIHRTQRNPGTTTANVLKSNAESAALDDKRTEAILREHLKLPAEKWDDFDHYDLSFSAQEAVEMGLAQEVLEFSPPAGTNIFNIL
jgi:ATP-dependent Clp protease, protease subunit